MTAIFVVLAVIFVAASTVAAFAFGYVAGEKSRIVAAYPDPLPQLDAEVFTVRFSNRAAVQDLRHAIELVEDKLIDDIYDDELEQIRSLLADAWDGLTLGLTDEIKHG